MIFLLVWKWHSTWMRNLACVVTGEDELVWTGSHSLTGRSQSQPHSYLDSLCFCCWNSILSWSEGIFRLIGNPLFCRCETILQPGFICTIRIERIEQRQGTGTRSFILWWRIMWCTNATTVRILNKKEELLKAWRKYAHPSPRRLLNQNLPSPCFKSLQTRRKAQVAKMR